MQIKEIELTNFRGIEKATFSLSPQINIFVGVNGSGKSSILEAIAISLSWLVNRIQRENSSGKPIIETNIKNDTHAASIIVEIFEAKNIYTWKISRTRKGIRSPEKSDLTEVSNLAAYFQDQLNAKGSLPVIAYYPINRVVNNVSPEISSKETINTIDIYENALGGKTNYQVFFEWFRIQDDILNERANSRTKWMISNKTWVKSKVNKLLTSLDKLIDTQEINEVEDFKNQIIQRFRKDSFIYEEPRYLFIELIDVLNFTRYSRKRDELEYDQVYRDLDYMFHVMATLSDSHRDNLIELNEYPFRLISQIATQISFSLSKIKSSEQLNFYKLIWDSLLFSVLLSLWWTSDKTKRTIETLFKKFTFSEAKLHEWSEPGIDQMVLSLRMLVSDDIERHKKASKNEGRELYYVTHAIEQFVPEYSNLRLSRIPRPQMLVDKEGQNINLDQLSDGEKNLIALVGDIARRLSIANGNSNNPLKGEGIILIDEIDLHLHPSWQRLMIPKLLDLFPNCQFIITTHSPQVISHAKPENIFLLHMENGIFSYSKALESFGKNTDRILEDLLSVDARPTEQKKNIHKIYTLIEVGNLNLAKIEIDKLRALIGDDPELVKAQSLIKRKEIIGK